MKLPPLSARDVSRALSQLGFERKRQSGSHVIFRHPASRTMVVVPDHGNKELKRGTLRSIIKQAEVGGEEFVRLAKK